MNTLDIIILIILLIGGLNGLRQGFIKAFANLVGWIFALIVGAKYAVILAPAMSSLSQDPVVQKIAAFAFIVLIIVVCTWIVSALLNGLLKSLKLGPLNRLAGGAFGFFYCLCSFDICTLPSLCPPVTYARYIANCVGVNAAIYIRAVC